MPLTRGVVIYPGTADPSAGTAPLAIAVVGTAASGTAPVNSINRISSQAEATALYGTHATGDTIPRTLEVLLRYGCNNIYVIKVADAASTVGSDVAGARTGIYAIKDIPARFNVVPGFCLIPGVNTIAAIDALDAVCKEIRSIGIIDPTNGDTINAVVTARNGATGIGKKSERLVIAYPHMKRLVTDTIIEPLSTHIAGAVARGGGVGRTISSLQLLGVKEPAIGISASVTDENSDTARLNNAGVVTVMLDGMNYETWGDRNALYPSDMGTRSFTSAIRAEDLVMQSATFRARKFIDLPSTIPTAYLAQESLNAMFYELVATNNLQYGKASWISSESNIEQGRLKYSLAFKPNLPVEIMEVAVSIGG